ncbi:MAG: A24 family peptidase C-terminal domain-containing protein [Methanocorpusculum sp.]|nr:A24 family peptidase C-terminal domain-containing protein [Methanocorpusculum sp.]
MFDPRILLAISAAILLITFIIASWQDLKTRTVYAVTWYPAAIACGILSVCFWVMEFISENPAAIYVLLTSLFVAGIMAMFTFFGLFGKADAKAMILLALVVPVTPFADWIFPSLAISSIINAGIVVLIVPVVSFIRNLISKNKAPFWLMCSGMPVEGSSITKYFGFVSELITEEDGKINREFCRPRSSINALRESSSLSLRELRENPDKYKEQLDLYAKSGKVWISHGIPLLIPITIGYVFALFGFSLVDLFMGLVL